MDISEFVRLIKSGIRYSDKFNFILQKAEKIHICYCGQWIPFHTRNRDYLQAKYIVDRLN